MHCIVYRNLLPSGQRQTAQARGEMLVSASGIWLGRENKMNISRSQAVAAWEGEH